jgi:hypothetical protein
MDLVASASASGDTQAVGQLVSSLADVLNSGHDGNTDARATRDVLIDAISSIADTGLDSRSQPMSDASVVRVSQMMSAVTANPEQLSVESSDKALDLVLTLTQRNPGEDKAPPVQMDVVQHFADVSSNILLATVKQTGDGRSTDGDGDTSSQQPRPEIAQNSAEQRGMKIIGLIDTLGDALSTSQVPGEPEASITTSSFGMYVQKESTTGFEGKMLGNGKVEVPSGALGSHTGSVSSKVTDWSVATNPLIWAADETRINASMKSTMVSVSFVDESSTPISISGLSQPFVIALDVGAGAFSNDSAFCAHWDPNLDMWVDDGVLLNRTSDQIFCSFDHLTSFGGLFGPSNELGSIDDLFSLSNWLQNVVGLVLVLVLFVLTCFVVGWSACNYTRAFKRTGQVIDPVCTLRLLHVL